MGVHAVAGGGRDDVETGQVESRHTGVFSHLPNSLTIPYSALDATTIGDRDPVMRGGPQRGDRVVH